MRTPTIARETAAASDVAADVVRVAAGDATPARDVLAVEEPLEIHLNGWRWLVTMRTPGADADLVLGMLASEAVITAAADVDSIVFRRHPDEPDVANVADVQLAQPVAELQRRLARNAALAASSCGLCGASSVAAILKDRAPLPPGPAVAARTIAELPARLAPAQPSFTTTGGLHAAGLFDVDGTLRAAREDIGRHNAVDKVIGWRLRDGGAMPPILLVSGRASFEIVQKALVAGIPIVAAVSAPSSLAVALACDAGMTLAGFVRDGGYNVYAGAERLDAAGRSRADADADAGGDPLAFIPRAVRDALDEVGYKISLVDWRALTRPERTRLVTLSEHAERADFAAYLVDRITARTGRPPRPLAAPAAS
jgi:FdhD protein